MTKTSGYWDLKYGTLFQKNTQQLNHINYLNLVGFFFVWIANFRVNCGNFVWQSSSYYQKSSQKSLCYSKSKWWWNSYLKWMKSTLTIKDLHRSCSYHHCYYYLKLTFIELYNIWETNWRHRKNINPRSNHKNLNRRSQVYWVIQFKPNQSYIVFLPLRWSV